MMKPCEVKLYWSLSVWLWHTASKTCLMFLHVHTLKFMPKLALLHGDFIASFDGDFKTVHKTA